MRKLISTLASLAVSFSYHYCQRIPQVRQRTEEAYCEFVDKGFLALKIIIAYSRNAIGKITKLEGAML